MTLQEKLELEIGKSKITIDPQIKKETDFIKLSTPTTSIESERAFSAAAFIGNKLRSSL